MQIEYDPTKNDKNIRERGLSFEMVEHFDFETAVLWLDVRKTYPEVRISALGILAGRVYSLVFAETAKGIRVISFRKAKNREVKRYEQKNQR